MDHVFFPFIRALRWFPHCDSRIALQVGGWASQTPAFISLEHRPSSAVAGLHGRAVVNCGGNSVLIYSDWTISIPINCAGGPFPRCSWPLWPPVLVSAVPKLGGARSLQVWFAFLWRWAMWAYFHVHVGHFEVPLEQSPLVHLLMHMCV